MDITVFTVAMRSEFLNSWQEEDPAKLAPWEQFTTVIDSTARFENYSWMSPAPGIQEYVGHRRLANMESIKYTVFNKEYDGSFEVLLRDVEDDQVGGYKLLPQDLAAKCKIFPGRLVLQNLANGKNANGFDGAAFFATTHNLGTQSGGTGGNIIAHTSTGSSDGASHRAILLYHGNKLKPVIYQNRKPPKFETDAGTPQSLMAKKARYWVDMEGASAYGWWWDAVNIDITNTPDVNDMHQIMRKAQAQFRTFILPKAIAGDPNEYVHEQTEFTDANTTIVVSALIEAPTRQALSQEWVPQTVGGGTVATTNLFRGAASLCVSAYLNP